MLRTDTDKFLGKGRAITLLPRFGTNTPITPFTGFAMRGPTLSVEGDTPFALNMLLKIVGEFFEKGALATLFHPDVIGGVCSA